MQPLLADWLNHFETLHPVGIDMGLTRVANVWQTLRKQHGIVRLANNKVITVAGTNGKGSACEMLTRLLSAQGYLVGTYTSPHIHHFRERVHINQTAVADDTLTRAFAAVERARGEISLSYFEATTLVGLLIFAWARVDMAVLEVGLGGRLDAINIIDADAVLITSIGLDHAEFLGRDLSKIALEKAGVGRRGAPCVYAQTDIYPSVIDFAQQRGIPLLANGRDYQLSGQILQYQQQCWQVPDAIANLGEQQISNCAGVLLLLAQLDLLPSDYTSPLSNFSLSGRMQVIAEHPTVIVDVAHNEDAARALAGFLRNKQLSSPSPISLYAVIGMLADKDHRAVLVAFEGLFDGIFCGSTTGERGFSDRELANIARTQLSAPVHACGTLSQALARATACAAAQPDSIVIAFGSFLVANALLTNNNIFK